MQAGQLNEASEQGVMMQQILAQIGDELAGRDRSRRCFILIVCSQEIPFFERQFNTNKPPLAQELCHTHGALLCSIR